MKTRLLTIFTAVALTACSGSRSVAQWSDEEVDAWFAASEWQTALRGKPAAGTDKRQFAEQVLRSPEAWQAALNFLRENDPATLAEGTYEVTPDGKTYATVARYTTKDTADFEAHRKYIDLQYVTEGAEYILIAPTDAVSDCTRPYDGSKDIAFYASANTFETVRADAAHFVLLFPNQAHKPCMKVGEKAPVKKIVVKIPYTE